MSASSRMSSSASGLKQRPSGSSSGRRSRSPATRSSPSNCLYPRLDANNELYRGADQEESDEQLCTDDSSFSNEE